MAGHSKWANIKHRKAAQDAKRGKVFTKLIRELVVAAKSGTPNPEDNPRLRSAIEKALNANMKRDTIDKAIKMHNDVTQGLSSSIFTDRLQNAEKLVRLTGVTKARSNEIYNLQWKPKARR